MANRASGTRGLATRGLATSDALAVDFGTSNSAAAVPEGGAVRRLPIERGAETLPTAVFFPRVPEALAGSERGAMRIGQRAVDALIEGEEGRFMHALKSVLGTALLHEARFLSGRRRTLAEAITAFLAEVKRRAEAEAGRPFASVLSGRPVRFHSDDATADARAEDDLRACYLAAGFEEVAFLTEPEAAAIASAGAAGAGDAGGIGLVVDIGGGTSDFSVFRGGAGERPVILATGGIRLGGTDFDRALSIARVMPELGLGTQLRRDMGPGLIPVPRAPFVDLATWVRIPFLYTPETRAMVERMALVAVEPRHMERMAHVLEMEGGHDLAFAVERGKIAVNDSGDAGAIAMDAAERGLSVPLDPADLDAVLAGERLRLREAAAATLASAGVAPGEVGRVVLIGGSSLLRLVRREMAALCPRAAMVPGSARTAVVDGLALAIADRG